MYKSVGEVSFLTLNASLTSPFPFKDISSFPQTLIDITFGFVTPLVVTAVRYVVKLVIGLEIFTDRLLPVMETVDPVASDAHAASEHSL